MDIINILKNKIKSSNGKSILNNLYDNFTLFQYNTYNNKYSRKIVKNHINNSNIEKQIYFNYIVNETIKLSKKLLDKTYEQINIKLDNIIDKNKNLKIIKELTNKNIHSNNISIYNILREHSYLLYIFFYTIPISRKLIEYVKDDDYCNFGRLYYSYLPAFLGMHNIFHSFNNERFVNYDRLNILLNKIDRSENTISIFLNNVNNLRYENKYIETYKKSFNEIFSKFNTFKKKFYYILSEYDSDRTLLHNYYNDFDFNKLEFKIHIIKLDIELDFFDRDIVGLLDSYIYLSSNSEMKIYYYKYNNIIDRNIYAFTKKPKHFYLFSHPSNTQNSTRSGFSNLLGSNHKIYNNNIKNISIILSYCLFLLKNKNIRDKIFVGMTDINKIKKIIIIFYYLEIFYMPFYAGTAAIAEISLFTLWDNYVNEPLIINQEVMLDIEVLSLTFREFYHNCFNKDCQRSKYTPYFNNSINSNTENLETKVDNTEKSYTENLKTKANYRNTPNTENLKTKVNNTEKSYTENLKTKVNNTKNLKKRRKCKKKLCIILGN